MRTQGKARTKPTGGRLHKARGKRIYEMGSEPVLTNLEKNKSKTTRTKGGSSKSRLLSAETVNLFDPGSKKYSKAKIKSVLKNPANRHFVRRNIITKGSIIDTDKGSAKVTSRPSQDGIINAVLVKE
ncbi:30S ribosomal protein S8e [Candidatus Woesearchaeota archaeon]|nr:30S ribosomal protein S8e [Candidatus Woesearchaeota archaeon]